MNYNDIKFDCKFFKGDEPCLPNKLRGKVCNKCDEYTPISKYILIIKLGALGDVIRTTPLIIRYRADYPDCHISWITNHPNILPGSEIDEIYNYGFSSVLRLKNIKFDIAVNLDKDKEACLLLNEINAKEKFGFIWNDGHIDALNPTSKLKLLTGLFDEYSKKNIKSYQEEIFEMCDLQFSKEPYLLELNLQMYEKWESLKKLAKEKRIVGLNTGCGKRWLTRLWPTQYWIELIRLLQDNNLYPLILGGADEDGINLFYSKQTGACYPGHYSLDEFMAISAHCDLIVTVVSMMMHIAIGLKKPLILFNNIFNKNEFELYGRGQIIEPQTGCDCYYGPICKRDRHCMEDISPQFVFESIIKHL